jgi:hypothetical protein
MTNVVMARPDEVAAGIGYVGYSKGGGEVKVGRRVDVGNV